MILVEDFGTIAGILDFIQTDAEHTASHESRDELQRAVVSVKAGDTVGWSETVFELQC